MPLMVSDSEQADSDLVLPLDQTFVARKEGYKSVAPWRLARKVITMSLKDSETVIFDRFKVTPFNAQLKFAFLRQTFPALEWS